MEYVSRLLDNPSSDFDLQVLQEIPEELVGDVIDIIAEESNIWRLRYIMGRIRSEFPNYELTPLQQLYLEMSGIRRWEQEYDNEWLERRLSELGIEQPSYTVYHLANRIGLADLYAPSDREIDSYSLNFLWVNLDPQDRTVNTARHIIGDGVSQNADDTLDKFVTNLSEWRRLNPEAEINLWFDSALVTEQAYLNTVDILSPIDVNLRDIRTLSNVPEYIQYSLHPMTALYYRVDMLKVLIGDQLFNENKRYAVVSDIDVRPMTKEQLFDIITVDMLDEYGYVFTNTGLSLFENSFFIFDTQNSTVRDNHREYMIDRVETALRSGKQFESTTIFNMYPEFESSMREKDRMTDRPRKPVHSPESQFNFGGSFRPGDIQYEQFNIITRPYAGPKIITRYGTRRSGRSRFWTLEPLLLNLQ